MSRFNLRQRQRISYYEPEEPNLDEYIFCEHCADYVYEYCSIHGPLLVVPDDKVPAKPNVPSYVPRAALTVPKVFLHLAPSVIPGAGLGVFTTLTLPRGVRFGPYRGEKTTQINSMYSWQIYDSNNKPSHVIDAEDANKSNWMRYVNCARHWCEQNLVAFQYQGQLYYRTIKIIPRFTELLVFYGSEFANSLRVDLRKYNAPSEYARKFGAPTKKPKLHLPKVRTANEDPSVPEISKVNEELEKSRDEASCSKVVGVGDKNNNLPEIADKFVCNECAQQFDKKDSIILHMNSNCTKHAQDLYFPCNRCAYTTVHKESLEKHSRFHDDSRKFVCDLCNYRFTSKNALKNHSKCCDLENNGSNTSLPVKAYSCTDCNKLFKQKCHLVRHMRIHTGEKPYPCSTCNKRFSDKSNLLIHMRLHTGEKPYPCSTCNKRFSLKSILVTHMRLHTGEKPYPCSTCNKRFSDKSTLVTHMRLHTGEKPYPCSTCNKRFIQKNNLVKHMRIHTGEKPYPCSTCNKRFNQKIILVTHMRLHTGEKPYPCSTCNQRFSDKSTLVTHMRLHTGEKPYPCSTCNKRFIQKNNLVKHMRIHTGEKPYPCLTCNKRFNQKNILVRHMRLHTGEKPYSCSDCKKQFRHVNSLRRHLKFHGK